MRTQGIKEQPDTVPERKYRSSAITEGSSDTVVLALHADQYWKVFDAYREQYVT